MSGLDAGRLGRLHDVMSGYVERDALGGVAWLAARDDDVEVGSGGALTRGEPAPIARDSIFRIASMSKPVTAVAALILLEECRLRLDDPVDDLLPELADRRVLARPGAPLDDTVPAARPITTRDLLTFRFGLGLDVAATRPQTPLARMAELELGQGPPAPSVPPAPDEWVRRLATLPLEYQPGERWLYHTSADLLGVLVARASGQSFDAFLRERIFDPLGMHDTGFSVASEVRDRFGPCFTVDERGERQVYDPADGAWSRPPAFPSGGHGLVSTVDDFAVFADMLRAGGAYGGERVLSRPSVAAMTTNHLTDGQLATAAPDPSGAIGWGYGVGVVVRRTGPTDSVGSYGWD